MNINKLRGKIVESGMNVDTLSSSIGMDKSTFYRKMKSRGETFTIKEVNLIREKLSLSKEEAMSIFFTSFVA